MRFLAEGPSLPDELLTARDEGRVLFFCGAGVSRAQAGLPGFLGLAERVLRDLRALPDNPARKLVEIAGKLQKEPIKGVGAILAADRIFGLLERDFALADIERAVGRALQPAPEVNLEAHRTLLELSMSPNRQVQLVTTNFDLLFEAVSPKVPVWTPSQLPDLRRHDAFHGIVHLHGMFDSEYVKPIGGNLVLSSAEFGRAYLAEGWATDFIRAAIERYLIVFVGYAADDPPVQYLLEALNRSSQQTPRGLYAFQEGRESEAVALWKQKGVTAIAYSADENHSTLWRTLTAWSKRAHDPARWRERVLRRALRGPEAMKPHERGQVVHLAATLEGAASIAEGKKPIPATWLCVFDPAMRYQTPAKADFDNWQAPDVDPFQLYGLDSDPQPTPLKQDVPLRRREAQKGVKDVLLPQPLDNDGTSSAGFRGDRSNEIAPLPRRLVSLAVWFRRVCNQPAALWWAADQKGLHPVVLRNVEFGLNDKESELPAARMGWRYLIEAWEWPRDTDFRNAYAVRERLKAEGWTLPLRRAFSEMLRPTLVAARPYGAIPPANKRRLPQRKMLRLSLSYSRDEIPIEIPDTELSSVLPLLRKTLEEAADLALEVDPYSIMHVPPIVPDPDLPGESSERGYEINRHILRYTDLFAKLIAADRGAALNEFAAWRDSDDPIFARLRVWASGLAGFLGAEQAGQILVNASDRVFWGSRDQRDVLVALAQRWNELSKANRRSLEIRLRKGLPRERRDDRKLYPKWRAISIAERLGWLKAKGCTFDFDIDAAIAAAQREVPDWKEEYVAHAADSMEGRGGGVHIDKSFSQLADVPIERLIGTALALHDHGHGFLLEHDPYAGLCEKRPLRVLAALLRAREPNEETRIAWTHFLQSGARRNDKARLSNLIARRLARIPKAALSDILSPTAYWLEIIAKPAFEIDPSTVATLLDKLTGIVVADPERAAGKKVDDDDEHRWLNAAWNSVIGHLVTVLLADPALSSNQLETALPARWIERISALLSLPGDCGRFALTMLARHLSWFYARDRAWTEATILRPIDTEGEDREAVLSGFLSNATINGEDLFARMKSTLITLATTVDTRHRQHDHVLASLFITAWYQKTDTGLRFLSDEELRIVIVYCSIEMRTHMLWHVDRWPLDDKLTLLKEVWPLQLAARSAVVSGRLCSIAFDDGVNFPVLAEAILPLLSPIEGSDFFVSFLHRAKENQIFERYPEHVLALLSILLSNGGRLYGVDEALARLGKASPKVTRDPRYVELKRHYSHRS